MNNFKANKGIFLGRDQRKKTKRLSVERSMDHIDIVGPTGSNKSVLATNILVQQMRSGNAIFAFDVKGTGDEFLPHVLSQEAAAIGRPFYVLDFTGDVPCFNPIANSDRFALEERLTVPLKYAEVSDIADHHRKVDRRATRLFCEFAEGYSDLSFPEIVHKFFGEHPKLVQQAEGFMLDMEELCAKAAFCAKVGLDLKEAIEERACVYVHSSGRNPVQKKLVNIFLISLIQVAERRDIASSPPISIFFDEYRFLVNRITQEALSGLRDKAVQAILCHQSLIGDFYDNDDGLSQEAITASIQENTKVKIIFKLHCGETATMLANNSGDILIDTEVREFHEKFKLFELRSGKRSLKEEHAPYIDKNSLLSLPKGVGVVFGDGLPYFISVSPIPVIKDSERIKPTMFEPHKCCHTGANGFDLGDAIDVD